MNNFKLLIRKNIPKLRNLLDNLGYYYFSSIDRINSDGYIYITDFKYYIIFGTPINCIDCGEDEELFLKYLYNHTAYYFKTHNKTELTTYQKEFLKAYSYVRNSIYGCLNSDNNNLPVEEVNVEIVPFTPIGNQEEFIKDNDKLITEQLDFILSDLSEDYREKYKDRVVFIKDIPVEKQKNLSNVQTNDKDTINTTLEIIMNDYSKDKIEIINPPTTIIKDNIFDNNNDNGMILFNYAYHLVQNKYFDSMKNYGKNRNHTTKHQPDKKSKKSARRNNRRAKRNNR